MTFERRFLLLVTGLLVLAVVVTVTALSWSAGGALAERARAEAERSAVRLARAAVLAREIPAAAEAAVAEQMVAQAALAGQLAAFGEAAKVAPKAVSDRLRAAIDGSAVAEITVTDSRGKPVSYTAANGGEVSFAPDSGRNAAFHGLLSRTPPVLVQPVDKREDGRIVKTVGVAGTDKPRIIQVSADARRLAEIARRMGLERAVEESLAGGASAAWVVAANGAALARGGAADAQLSPAEQGAAKDAGAVQRPQLVQADGAISAVAPVEGGGVAVVRVPAPVSPVSPWAGILAGLLAVAGGAAVVQWLLRQETAALERLTAAATALEAGRFNPFTLDPLRERPDEVGRLARAFRSMAGSIDAREQGLEAELLMSAARLEEGAGAPQA